MGQSPGLAPATSLSHRSFAIGAESDQPAGQPRNHPSIPRSAAPNIGVGSLVSIVIAAHNAVRYLGETLTSATAQRYDPLEIIVVDDGSTDATGDLVREWSQRDSRIRLIRQANAGVGAARNTGIATARGRYIAPLDADDLWDPDKIGAQVAEMELWGPRAGFAYCWVRTINELGRVTGVQPKCSASGQVFGALLIGNFLHNASVPLFRADALKVVGGYATREDQGGVQGCEDWELCLRLAHRYDVCAVPRVLVSYRIVQSGMSFNVRGMELSYLWLLEQARHLRRSLPESIFRWSKGQFYLYLALKARQACIYRETRRCLRNAAQADFAKLLTPVLYYSWAVSWYRQWFPRGPARRTLRTRREQALADAALPQPRGSDHWRLRSLINARLLWSLYTQVERRRSARLFGTPRI